jgi:hypothetical protein
VRAREFQTITVPMNKTVRDELAALKEKAGVESEFVFPHRKGEHARLPIRDLKNSCLRG